MRWHLDHITVRYRLPSGETVNALNDVTLDLSSGDRVAVVGHNGSGKSTLARVLAGVITATRGGITVDEDGDAELPAAAVHAALVLQNPDDNIIGETVREELELTLGPIRGRAHDAVVVRGLQQFGLGTLLDRRTAALSGGETQLLALACGLMSGRQLVVLDEPTSHLDPPSRHGLIEKLLNPTVLHQTLSGDHPTVVLITQYEAEARRFPRVIELQDGAIVYDGRSEQWAPHEGEGAPILDDGVLPATGKSLLEFVIPANGKSERLRVNAGDRIGLIGRIGSGKTTLAYRLAGLLDDAEPVESDMDGNNAPVVLIQFPERQLFAETVSEDVAFGPRNQGRGDDGLDELVRGALAGAGLSYAQFAQRSPFSLSGGQKHRAAIAGVIACDAPLYILDEPTSALDREGLAAVNHTLANWASQGVPYVVISHDVDWLQTVTRRVWVLAEGHLTADTTWDAPECRPALQSIGFA